MGISRKDGSTITSKLYDTVLTWIPGIPNIQKWFEPHVQVELALIRYLISETTQGTANDIASLSLSRIIVRVSNQDSETRYTARDKGIQPTETLKQFLVAFDAVLQKVRQSSRVMQYADVELYTDDTRSCLSNYISPNSIGFVVTSPPYPNVTDYHLYHRFRLYWLGYDPRDLANVEIGSHLRHQRDNTSFSAYCEEMNDSLKWIYHVLQPGRYAAFIVGDAVYKGETFDTAQALYKLAEGVGFEACGIIDRPVHATKRSFTKPGRRAKAEKILILRKPNLPIQVALTPPYYKMWPYEHILRLKEISAILNVSADTLGCATDSVPLSLEQEGLTNAQKLTFSHAIAGSGGSETRTWQRVLENGDGPAGRRKEPKYVTHGIHGYKGKFYPQLVKSLINIQDPKPGDVILDPFCGSGTSILEGFLNGYKTVGFDMNPLAAKIARAKVETLHVEQQVTEDAISALLAILNSPPTNFTNSRSEFNPNVVNELADWFPSSVLDKMNWILHQIRLFGRQEIVEYFEVILSSLLRDVSQQAPDDLRIRRRETAISDAPLISYFRDALAKQLQYLQKYWSVVSRKPCWSYPAHVEAADAREKNSFTRVGLERDSVDLIVTSPPYATALPYIDTDRLSLMAIMGYDRAERSQLERRLTGSREISTSEKRTLEDAFRSSSATNIPDHIRQDIIELREANRVHGGGFRKQNMPSLLWRYFTDMRDTLENLWTVLKPGSSAIFVVGNSKTKVGSEWWEITTGQYISDIAEELGFDVSDVLDVSVTTENLRHIKHSITENSIYQFRKPLS